ncbi:hypothetical protein [Bradyrhizobium sp. AS23.2]|uniref:SMP-30/gluconolactonase/LRE family protein n=1 Tax=Bradyrhizobium sp. AS23.2 TaxID=1680155 RepID=UPI0009395119|nr:hypothetical protein [Bradyrhizobium sp. AS23.2]
MFDHLLRNIRSVIDRGNEQAAIPPLDGALSPNDRLDACTPIGAALPGLDDVVVAHDGSLFVSAGSSVLRFSGTGFATRTLVAKFDGDAGGLAIHPDGRLLVCVAARGLAAIDPAKPRPRWLGAVDGHVLAGLQSVTVTSGGRIFAVEGSTARKPDAWRHDLMEKRRSGRLIACDAALDGATTVLSGLRYPYGLAVAPDDAQLWYSESWGHCVSRIPLSNKGVAQPEIVLRNLPGYPARLRGDGRGGFYLALFARRTHLIEFVLREDDFRREMIATMPPGHWIAPAYASGNDCREPMQIGGVKALGIRKPWAPPRSYGLLMRIDAEGETIDSMHSRASGRFHGITGACATPQGTVIAARGAGQLLLSREI